MGLQEATLFKERLIGYDLAASKLRFGHRRELIVKKEGHLELVWLGISLGIVVFAGLLTIGGALVLSGSVLTAYYPSVITRILAGGGLTCLGPLTISLYKLTIGAKIYTGVDLLMVLTAEWKHYEVIEQDLMKLKGARARHTLVDDFFRKPGIGLIFGFLDRLEGQGMVESRFKPGVTSHGRLVEMEHFRLTQGGIKKKHEIIEREKSSQGSGTLQPHPQ